VEAWQEPVRIPTAKVMQLLALMKLLDSKKVNLGRFDGNNMPHY